MASRSRRHGPGHLVGGGCTPSAGAVGARGGVTAPPAPAARSRATGWLETGSDLAGPGGEARRDKPVRPQRAEGVGRSQKVSMRSAAVGGISARAASPWCSRTDQGDGVGKGAALDRKIRSIDCGSQRQRPGHRRSRWGKAITPPSCRMEKASATGPIRRRGRDRDVKQSGHFSFRFSCLRSTSLAIFFV
jgi:hypothetical protein